MMIAGVVGAVLLLGLFGCAVIGRANGEDESHD